MKFNNYWLESNFKKYWEALSSGRTDDLYRKSVYDYIVYCYTDPRRHYHSIDHIDNCIYKIKDFKLNHDDESIVGLSLFFHDIVYDSDSKINEALSANIAGTMFSGFFSDILIEEVVRNILATKHALSVSTRTAQVVVDIDLSGLGSDYLSFQINTHKIRQEYPQYNDSEFFSGRATFFNAMLSKSQIFYTPEYTEKYEHIARANMTLEYQDILKWKKEREK